MKTATLLLTVAGFALAAPDRHASEQKGSLKIRHAQARAACNADNCARAVSGTNVKVPFATRSADCASFFQYTVTPATVTSTVTVTPGAVTVTTTDATVAQTLVTAVTTVTSFTATTNVESYPANSANVARRQQTPAAGSGATTVSPSAVPAYASPCSGTARYSSACSCLGATKTTVTAAAPTTTATVTAPAPIAVVEATAVTTVVVPTTAVQDTTYVYNIPCNRNINGPYDGFLITVVCEAVPSSPGNVVGTDTFATYGQCVDKADRDPSCTSFEYELSTGLCTRYHDSNPAYGSSPATGKVFAHFNNG